MSSQSGIVENGQICEAGGSSELFRQRLLRIFLGMLLCWIYLGVCWFCEVPKSHILRSLEPLTPGKFIGIDTPSYVNSPKGDMFRTVGYPIFIRTMKKLFGENWIAALLVVQTFVISLVFWAVEVVADLLLESPFKYRWTLWFMMIGAGLYYTSTPIMLTDAMCASLFLIGLGFALRWHWFVAVVIIGIAAQIRPSFTVLPIAWVVLMYYRRALRKPAALGALALLIVFTQLPCLRNYINHGQWVPTNVMSVNVGMLKSTIAQYDSVVLGVMRTTAGATLCTPWVDHVSKIFGFTEKSFGLHFLTVAGIVFYVGLWVLFLLYVIKHWRLDLIALVGMFVLPACIAGGGARIRLPIEPIIMICAIQFVVLYFPVLRDRLRGRRAVDV